KRAQVPAGSPENSPGCDRRQGNLGGEPARYHHLRAAASRGRNPYLLHRLPNVYNSWPVEYAVSHARRGSQFAPTYLGVAILGRDRFGYARGPGVLTTHPWAVEHDEELALNADGDDVSIRVLSESGETMARGRLGEHSARQLYRKVIWTSRFPKGAARLHITLGPNMKLYRLEVE